MEEVKKCSTCRFNEKQCDVDKCGAKLSLWQTKRKCETCKHSSLDENKRTDCAVGQCYSYKKWEPLEKKKIKSGTIGVTQIFHLEINDKDIELTRDEAKELMNKLIDEFEV